MTFLTALIIQTNGDNIVCTGVLDGNTGKFAGFIGLHKYGRFHTFLLSEPMATHDTADEAIAAMKQVVEKIRAADLSAELQKQRV